MGLATLDPNPNPSTNPSPSPNPNQACAGGHAECVSELVAAGADINGSSAAFPWTPLHCATAFARGEVRKCSPTHSRWPHPLTRSLAYLLTTAAGWSREHPRAARRRRRPRARTGRRRAHAARAGTAAERGRRARRLQPCARRLGAPRAVAVSSGSVSHDGDEMLRLLLRLPWLLRLRLRLLLLLLLLLLLPLARRVMSR